MEEKQQSHLSQVNTSKILHIRIIIRIRIKFTQQYNKKNNNLKKHISRCDNLFGFKKFFTI